MRKLIILFSFLLLTAWPSPVPAKTIIDQAGRSVTVPDNPTRIICLGPGALRLIVYLRAQDRVVGVEAMEKRAPIGRPYWRASPALATLPDCGPGGPAAINKKPDMETVLSLSPQVIFITWMDAALADTVQNILGIPLVVLSYGTFATFDEALFDALRIAGFVLGKRARAEEIVTFIQSQRQQLATRTAGIPEKRRPRAYAGGIGFRGTHGIESSEQNYIPLEWAGARNLADSVTPGAGSHVFLDRETLLALDPEVIFIDGGGLELVRADYGKKKAFYTALHAFTHGRVHVLLPFNHYATNIGTALADAWAVGKILYPDRFADVDLSARADDIYSFLVGAPVCRLMEKTFGSIGHTPEWIR